MQLDDLYQEIILDHFKHPRHADTLAEEEVLVDEENPTCGDRIRLTASLRDGRVESIRYQAEGCAISVASSSMMADDLVGRPVEEVRERIRDLIALMKGQKDMSADAMGDMAALEGVKQYPLRVKCATMCWHAVDHALDKLQGT